jgi:NitT/TauT family transport system substrate-binding protein
MSISRRAALLAALAMPAASLSRAVGLPAIRVGVLRFGTVSWELDVIKHHKLDTVNGVAVEPVEFAGAAAAQVALQAKRVDTIVPDWLWVSRQRDSGADWTFVPFSNAVGSLIAPPSSPVRKVTDLPGRRLGIAGSPLDKSWLILRAYAQRRYGIDLDRTVDKSFAAPPLLEQELLAARLDAVLTQWAFAARAEAAGMRPVLSVEAAIEGLGVGTGVPIIGYVFSEHWAADNSAAMQGFLAASRAARDILARSDTEWERLAPLLGTADIAVQAQLKAYYRRGIPQEGSGQSGQAEAAALYRVLADIGGPALVGHADHLAEGTFWQPKLL